MSLYLCREKGVRTLAGFNDDLNLVVTIDTASNVSTLRGEIAKLSAKLKSTPLKLEVELDNVDGIKKMTAQFANSKKEISALQAQISKLKAEAKGMSASLGGKAMFADDAKKATDNMGKIGISIKKLEAEARKFDTNGVFSFKEIKDGKNNIVGLESTLESASGKVQKIYYDIKQGANGQSEAIQRNITMISKEQHAQEQIRAVIERVNLERKKGNLTDNQSEKLIASLKNQSQNYKQVQATMAGYVGEAKRVTAQELATQNAMLKSNQIIEQAERLKRKLGSSAGDTRARTELEVVQAMARSASSTQALTEANIRLKQAQTQVSNALDNNKRAEYNAKIKSSITEINRLQTAMKKMGTNVTIDDSLKTGLDKIKNNVKMSTKEIENIMKRANDQLKKTTKAYQDTLKMESYGKVVSADKLASAGGIDQLSKMWKNQDTTGIKNYISSVSGATAETMKFKQVMDSTGKPLQQVTVGFRSTGKEAKSVTYTLDETARGTTRLRQGFEELSFNANRNLGVWEQLRVAMTRFPLWMLAQTAFRGSIRGIREMSQEILQVDKSLTEMKRVIGAGISLDELFKGSVDVANELGNNVYDVLGAVEELARTFDDFNEQQVLAVANTATLMANVSDLNAEQAINSLVGTMKAFNIEAEDSIRIVDVFNEVDNNFAISTLQIAEAMEKSASTAKTFGVSMEENVANITAIGSVTMESGQVIGNALKTIYSRITTLGASEAILKSVGVSIKEIGTDGVATVKPVQKIMTELAGKWNYLSSAQQQNIAVQIAGRNQLSRFLAIMNNWQTVTDATSTAMNSQGSAMRENQAYLESYEAKINKLKTAFTKFSLAVGDSIMKDGLSLLIEGLSGLANVSSKAVQTFGALPSAVLALSPILLKFNPVKTLAKQMTWAGTVKIFDGFKNSLKSAFTGVNQTNTSGWQSFIANNNANVKVAKQQLKEANSALSSLAKVNPTVNSEAPNRTLKVQTSDLAKLRTATTNVAQANATLNASNLRVSDSGGRISAASVAQTSALNNVRNASANLAEAQKTATFWTSSFGLALKGLAVSMGIGVAIAGVMWAITKLTSALANQRAEQAKMESTTKNMVKQYRESGDSISGMIDKYDELYKKYGEFNQAVSTGAITPELNSKDYEEYEKVISSLSEKMPTMVKYTDAQGRAYLKTTEAMREQLKYASELSKKQAEVTTDAYETKIKGQVESMRSLSESYKQAGEDFTKYQGMMKNGFDPETATLNDAGAIQLNVKELWEVWTTGITMAEMEQRKLGEATQSALASEQGAREKLQKQVRESITSIKEYVSASMEASGALERLGSTSKALVENFTINNSKYLEEIPDLFDKADKNYGDQVAKEFEKRTIQLTNASLKIAEAMDNAMQGEIDKVSKSDGLNKYNQDIDKIKANFESLASVIPKSMQTLDSSGNASQALISLIDNSGSLLSINEQLSSSNSDAQSIYSSLRGQLEGYGLSIQEADQMIRNLAQSNGNVAVQNLIASETTDELTQSMTDLKNATLETMDAQSLMLGISGDNVSAMKGYFDAVSDAQLFYGDSYKSSAVYAEAILKISEAYGVTTSAVENNYEAYKQVSDIMSEVSIKGGEVTESQNEQGETIQETTERTVDFGNLTGEALDKAKLAWENSRKNATEYKDELDILNGLVPELKNSFESLQNIKIGEGASEVDKMNLAYIQGKVSVEAYKEAQNKPADGGIESARVKFAEMQTQIEAGTGSIQEYRKTLEEMNVPEEVINSLIANLQEIKNKKDELGNPTTLDVVAGANTALTQAQVKDILKDVVDADGKLITIDTSLPNVANAQQALDNLVQKAKDNGVNEILIKSVMEGDGDANTKIEALKTVIEGLGQKTDETSEKTKKIGESVDTSGADAKISTTYKSLDDLLVPLNKAQESSTNVVSEITKGLESISAKLEAVKGAVSGVGDITNLFKPLASAVDGVKGGIIESSNLIGANITTLSGTASTHIGTFQNFYAELNNIKSATDGASSSISGFSGIVSGSATSFQTLVTSISGVISGLSIYNSAITLAISATSGAGIASIMASASFQMSANAKLNEASAYVTAGSIIASTRSSYDLLRSASLSMTSSLWSHAMLTMNSYIIMRASISNSLRGVSSAMSAMAMSVMGSTSNMIAGHNSQVDAINRVANKAREAREAVSSFNSTMGTAMFTMANFIAQARRVQSEADVSKSKSDSAKSSADKMKNAELMDAIGNIAKTGQSTAVVYQSITGATMASDGASGESGVTVVGGSGTPVSPTLSSYMPQVFSMSELETPYSIVNWEGNGRVYEGIDKLLKQMQARLAGMNKESATYRATLQNVINMEQKRLALLKTNLKMSQDRKAQIEAELKRLPAVNKQNEGQRKTYNALQAEYDKMLKEINSFSAEIESLTYSVRDNIQAQFEDFINEIVTKYDTAIKTIQKRVDDTEFELNVLAYVDEDNIGKKLSLLMKKQQDQLAQQSNYKNLNDALKAQLADATKKYGANSDRAKYVQDQLDAMKKAYQDMTLDVLKTEKEIADVRASVADDSISKLKDYYSNMKKMAQDAIKAEQDALKKAQEEKNKIYDKEIAKINEVYDAKNKSIDKEKSEEEYNEKLGTMEADRAKLQKQIAQAQKDTSLAGKKRLAELQEELAKQNKEIADAQKERQAELLKEQLEAEKQAQIDAINKKKEDEEKALQDKLDALDKESEDVGKKYDDILENDEYWANMKDKVLNGSFAELNQELQKMYSNLGQMGNGAFDGLLDGFDTFSEEAQKTIKDMYENIIKNMQFGEGTNMLELLAQLMGTGSYKPTDGNGGNKQNAMGTPAWMTGNSNYSPDNILTSSGTAPAPPAPPANSGGVANGAKPVVGGTYVVQRDVGAYYTSDDAKAYRSRRGTVKKGTYWIYNIWNGMINVTNQKGAMGSWINPAENKGGLDANGAKVADLGNEKSKKGEESVNGKIVNDSDSGRGYRGVSSNNQPSVHRGLNTAGMQQFRSGGYTGEWNDRDGKLAVLHQKELVLNKNQTQDILKSAKIMENIKHILPLMKPNLSAFEFGEGNTNEVYDIDINIEKFSGTQKEADSLLDTIDKAFKKRGKFKK